MKKKYVMSRGLAFGEEKDMAKLRSYAKEGWVLDRFAPFGFLLKKGEAQDLSFAVDYNKNPDDEYFAYFDQAGWTHVCSEVDYIHVFSAAEGTKPIYSDRETTLGKYEVEKKRTGRVALPSLIATILLFVLGNLESITGIMGEVLIWSGFLTMIVFIFSGMPYVGYQYKLSKLKKG
ncbi:hypothetical protein AAV35_000540 [Salimicrobium jeotgali]|uniref:DUF2812 domain-containing protein n=1 Tax=Salimicrobium jeotgali TaxID=1230341 RepID=K2FIF0_9BACI|nr:DUF2812 domain-containing protein [Salimicrobium jeotgali]AKG03413.1 hypothetical protein AAV35_000540 [Salimicrobium jeotgali]EKE30871.1 hypothetical protein MJ3_11240 [Salimicrobium jeotgali]MBM7697665.1 hypothetical protein [Salimicrobium jeotgali]